MRNSLQNFFEIWNSRGFSLANKICSHVEIRLRYPVEFHLFFVGVDPRALQSMIQSAIERNGKGDKKPLVRGGWIGRGQGNLRSFDKRPQFVTNFNLSSIVPQAGRRKR